MALPLLSMICKDKLRQVTFTREKLMLNVGLPGQEAFFLLLLLNRQTRCYVCLNGKCGATA